jgi:hypothetical protein
MRLVIPLLLAAVAATGCAAQAQSTSAQSTSAQSTSAQSTSAGAPTTTSTGSSAGGPVDACKYFTQADAESMLGVSTGPGRHESVTNADSTCAYLPSGAATPGTRVALTVSAGEFAGSGTLTEFKSEWPDAVGVTGLAFPAMRNANGSNFAMQGNDRGCGLIISIKKPADPDAFARQVGAICAKALAN